MYRAVPPTITRSSVIQGPDNTFSEDATLECLTGAIDGTDLWPDIDIE